jgi:hypothetical protein
MPRRMGPWMAVQKHDGGPGPPVANSQFRVADIYAIKIEAVEHGLLTTRFRRYQSSVQR